MRQDKPIEDWTQYRDAHGIEGAALDHYHNIFYRDAVLRNALGQMQSAMLAIEVRIIQLQCGDEVPQCH